MIAVVGFVLGLSPRVRGNLGGVARARLSERSIPACAGEPPPLIWVMSASMVYPRVCGGTIGVGANNDFFTGLSPRVRGNPPTPTAKPRSARSIPACAGEPASCTRWRGAKRVYPRVCGGTLRGLENDFRAVGLSPRVRGNRPVPLRRPGAVRSIPACAGEPRAERLERTLDEVYPRVCGGTSTVSTIQRGLWGLSPRVRGNPANAAHGVNGMRSIPACAGEPAARR